MVQADPTVLTSMSASRLCDEEEKSLQYQATKLYEAWTVIARLFDIWDVDESGELDKNELLAGVAQFCDLAGLDFDSRRVISIFGEADGSDDLVLDRREFSVFISRFADSIDVPLDDFSFLVAEQLSDIVMKPTSVPKHGPSPVKQPFKQAMWKGGSLKIASRTQVVDQRRESWARLQFASEALYKLTPSPWERLRVGLAMQNYRTASQNEKSSATIDLWFSIQHALVLKKKGKAEVDAVKEAGIVETQTDSSPRGFMATIAAIKWKGETVMIRPSNIPLTQRSVNSQWIKDCFSVRRRGYIDSNCDLTLLGEHEQYDEEQLLSVSQLENFQVYVCAMQSNVPPYEYDTDTQEDW